MTAQSKQSKLWRLKRQQPADEPPQPRDPGLCFFHLTR